jgi:hypothetical protein
MKTLLYQVFRAAKVANIIITNTNFLKSTVGLKVYIV